MLGPLAQYAEALKNADKTLGPIRKARFMRLTPFNTPPGFNLKLPLSIVGSNIVATVIYGNTGKEIKTK